MGLKSGSRSSGLDDSQTTAEQDRESDAAETPQTHEPLAESDSNDGNAPSDGTDVETTAERPTKQSLPYKLRREKVNAGREQIPFFLRDEVVDAEGDLQNTLEELLGENVYKSDYREAAMIVAQRNPTLIAEVLREWGYDLDAI